MHHKILRLQQFPEFLEDLGGELGGYAAEISQFFRQPLHIQLRKCPQYLLGQALSYCQQENGGLAHAADLRCHALSSVPGLKNLIWHGSSFRLPGMGPCQLRRTASIGMNPALQQARALRRLSFQVP